MAKKKKDPAPEEEDEKEDPKKAKAKGKGKAEAAEDADGEGDGGEGAEGEGAAKKLPLIKIAIFAGAPLLLIIVGVTVAFFLGIFGGKHEAEEAEAHEKPAANEVQFYDLPEILVNLNTGGKQATYLKLQVAVEIPKEADVTAIEPALPRVLDRFQVFLRELRLEDLNGSAGTYRLKQELLRRVRLSGLAVPVNDVLIREMIIQ
jgi:flagellar FliL protein